MRQGSDAIYHAPFYKGHLVPGATYSSTEERFRSTFVYTNAVPQRDHNAQVSTKAIDPNLRREYGSTLNNARKESYLELYI